MPFIVYHKDRFNFTAVIPNHDEILYHEANRYIIVDLDEIRLSKVLLGGNHFEFIYCNEIDHIKNKQEFFEDLYVMTKRILVIDNSFNCEDELRKLPWKNVSYQPNDFVCLKR